MGAEPGITENHNIPKVTKMNVKKVTNIQKVMYICDTNLNYTRPDQIRQDLEFDNTPMLLLPAFPILIDAHA